MIKAIIFDCFGVLTTDGWLAFKHKHFSSDKNLYDEVTKLNRRVDAGLIKYDEFIEGVGKLAGISYDQALHEIENNVADGRVFDYIRDNLKANYKIGMLSNAAANWVDRLFEPEQAALLDVIVISSEIGITKPDERAYLITAEKLGVEPEECVFIDDQEWYVAAARDVGMKGIYYQSFQQMTKELEELLK